MPRKADLGFKVITADDTELRISTPEDLAQRKADKKYESWLKSKEAKLRYWHRNKHRYNAKKRRERATVEGMYAHAERAARENGQDWEFTIEEWEQVWLDAGWLLMPGSRTNQFPRGKVVPAFYMRGPHNLRNTFMRRVDVSKPWRSDNVEIMFRGAPLRRGNKWYREHE